MESSYKRSSLDGFPFPAAFVLVLSLCAALNFMALQASRPAIPPPAISLSPDTAVQSATLLGLGMQRLAADIEFIDLLVYYGTPENGPAGGRSFATGAGDYPELGPRGRRIAELDPTFDFAVEYAAGALAFNVGRPDEALALLRFALRGDPGNSRYQQYLGAVAFAQNGDIRSVVDVLGPLTQQPDCPAMIKSMVAFMELRLGERDKAVSLLRDLAEHSLDPGYKAIARTQLERLGVPPGR